MPNETDLQSYVIKVVRANGGAARKLSHRFNLGVSDLLIKLPRGPINNVNLLPALLLEVKLHRCALDSTRPYKLDLTKPQLAFLREFEAAGMRVGVLSFVIGSIGQHRNQLAIATFNLDFLEKRDYRVSGLKHRWLANKADKDNDVLKVLEGFARG